MARLTLPLTGQDLTEVPLYDERNIDAHLKAVMWCGVAEAITCGLSNPSKMPTFEWGRR